MFLCKVKNRMNCGVYTRYCNPCIIRCKFMYVYGVVCVLSWNMCFSVCIYRYIVMSLVLRVCRALYDLFFRIFFRECANA